MNSDFQIPEHLKKYIVEQDYSRYTPIDHSVWRFILRQLKSFLSVHAHSFYMEGLDKTGIEIEKIPSIADISQKIEKFGWKALPVSGFIPPAAFMEMQSYGLLPIASDIRSLDHLMYTPAPDIVHEAAGHAPFLAHSEFANYLKQYAQVAKKAIISKEDLDQYEAIRILSDVKENPDSTPEQIQSAEQKLNEVTKNISHISEAAELGRMNWWTAEYGLIGDLENPQIFGAGLLSSVGESRWCLNPKVKKIPLTSECVKQGYDITEPQPQLFVTPNFAHLTTVLNDFAKTMAYQKGGLEGLHKAQKAQAVTTVQLNSGIQISGVLSQYKLDSRQNLSYLKMNGPTQLSYQDQELKGHDKNFHQHGFSTLLGPIKGSANKCPSELSPSELESLGLKPNQKVRIKFESGIILEGTFIQNLVRNQKQILWTFENCKVTFNDEVLFDPSWGSFDMAIGSEVVSVFGGPADRRAYGEMDDFVAARVNKTTPTEKMLQLQNLYTEIRNLRDNFIVGEELFLKLSKVFSNLEQNFSDEWLLRMEILELHDRYPDHTDFKMAVHQSLKIIQTKSLQNKDVIDDGFHLIPGL